MTMTDTLKLIKDYNFWGSDRKVIDAEAEKSITDLALDPVNLAEYPAVTDLRFVGTM